MHNAILIAGIILDVLGVAFLIAVCTGKLGIPTRRRVHAGADAGASRTPHTDAWIAAAEARLAADEQIHD